MVAGFVEGDEGLPGRGARVDGAVFNIDAFGYGLWVPKPGKHCNTDEKPDDNMHGVTASKKGFSPLKRPYIKKEKEPPVKYAAQVLFPGRSMDDVGLFLKVRGNRQENRPPFDHRKTPPRR